MELIQKGSPKYFIVSKEYSEVIKNITREDSYDKFIGGLPITLERKDIFTLVSKDLQDNYRYSITQKVDGHRMLLFAAQKESSGYRKIYLVDRNNDFYIPKNLDKLSLPTFNGPRLLIDGEIVIFDNNKEASDNVKIRPEKVHSFAYMAFDILYGPISIEYKGLPNQSKLLIGSEGAFCGPKGGKMWSYKKRYDILHKLIYPSEFNDYRPPLNMAFLSTNWITIEIKPIYFINSLKLAKVIYSIGDNKGYFNSEIRKYRENFYELLNKIKTERGQKTNQLFLNIKLDGLIFTPFDTEYIIGGPWKKFLNIQYKWKPVEEQSIDFFIEKQGNDTVLLKVRKGKSIITFTDKVDSRIVPSKVKITQELKKVKTGTIGEFTFNNKTKEFELLRIRADKDSPNALSTALNVRNAINKPVDLNIIKKFFIIDKLTETGYSQLLRNLTKAQLLRCSLSNKMELLSTETKTKILSQIEQFQKNSDFEFEVRLGLIEPSRFQSNLPFSLYKQIIDILSLNNIKWTYTTFMDYFKNSRRSRYLYLEDLGNYVHEATIMKEKKEKIDFESKYIYNADMRFSLANEKVISQETDRVTRENADMVLIKKRFTFDFDNINIDCTEISVLDKVTNKATTNNYQIEFEVKNRKGTPEEILDKVITVITNILNNINN